MIIKFSPYVLLPNKNETLSLENTVGDRIRINGELFNFDPLPDDGIIEAGVVPCEFIEGPVRRVNGQLELTILLPIPSDCKEKHMCFPEPITVNEPGVIDVPFATYQEVTENEDETIIKTYSWKQKVKVETIKAEKEENNVDAE